VRYVQDATKSSAEPSTGRARAPDAAPRPTGRDDVIRSADAEWLWWKHVVLRGAGFPAAGVLRLGAADLAAKADRILTSQDHLEWSAFEREFATATAALAREIQDIAQMPSFREALVWQNPEIVQSAIRPLLRWRPDVNARNSNHRRHEEVVASYWQRYCVKNDTIGFFGPVGWGKWNPSATGTRVRVGSSLVDRCEIYFAAHAIERLAAAIELEPGVKQWIPPRRVPFLCLESETVTLPHHPAVRVPEAVANLLGKCDGRSSARDIAADVGAGEGGPTDEAEVLALLEQLAKRRWVVWKLEVPIGLRPEDALRESLDRIGDCALRDPALEKLNRLESAREQVRTAAGDPDRLASAIEELERTLERLAGSAPRRTRARPLVFRDCRRAVELDLGVDLLRALEPLDLLLRSARWFTFRVGEAVNAALVDLYRRLADRHGPRDVDLGTFWFEAMPVLHRAGAGIADRNEHEFQRKWRELLECDLAEARLRYSTSDLREKVHDAFEAPRSGWPGARYYSPDIAVVARDVEAIGRGDFELVLSELHLAINTLRSATLVAQHPDARELLASVEADFPRPRLMAVLPKEDRPRLTMRTQPAFYTDKDAWVALFHHTLDSRAHRILMSADVVVDEADGLLLAVSPDGERFDLRDVFAEPLMNLIVHRFQIFGDESHTPRLYVDRVVVNRETWNVDPLTLDFAEERQEARRYVEARRWCRDQGLPQHVFVKSPLEEKPFYVDFSSPVYVNVLAKAVRRLCSDNRGPQHRRVKFVEMLPLPDQGWLVDAEGNRYSSELRLVAVDSRGA
jgi:Lantibiotic dehydratase, N terminus